MYDNLIRLIDVWLDQFGTGHASGSSIPKISLRLNVCSELGLSNAGVLIWIDIKLIMPRYAFWKIDPYAPAAQVDIRRKPQQCQRVHMLWSSNKHKSQSAEKFLISNDLSNQRAHLLCVQKFLCQMIYQINKVYKWSIRRMEEECNCHKLRNNMGKLSRTKSVFLECS